jgi:hypothetical protein
MYIYLYIGAMEAGFTLLFAYVATETRFFAGDMDIRGCSIPSQAGTWLQMSIASEILIFSARAPSFIVTSIAPSVTLFSSVMAGCLFLSLLTGVVPYFGYLSINDIVLIWGYNIITLFFIDCVKVAYLQYIGDSLDVLPEQVPVEDMEETGDLPLGSPMYDAESGPTKIVYEEEVCICVFIYMCIYKCINIYIYIRICIYRMRIKPHQLRDVYPIGAIVRVGWIPRKLRKSVMLRSLLGIKSVLRVIL